MAATRTPAPTDRLETEVCGRCGGTGRHSFCTGYGDTCFGCGGSGRRFTKRGKAAKSYLETLRSVPARQIVVGDLIKVDLVTMSGLVGRYFATVTDVTPSTTRYIVNGEPQTRGDVIDIHTTSPKYGDAVVGMHLDGLVRKGWSAEEKAAQLRQAIEYQATLRQDGKPGKNTPKA